MNRVILITGANRGLGYQLAQKLALDNYNVIITGRDKSILDKVSELKKLTDNNNIIGYQLDIEDQQSIINISNQLLKDAIKIDVLVNNAGVCEYPNYIQPRKIFDINFYGTINCTKMLLQNLQTDGKIITISSRQGKLNLQPQKMQETLNVYQNEESLFTLAEDFIVHQKGFNNKGEFPSYMASKAILNAYNRYILTQLVGPQQTVYIIHPGWTKTEMGGQEAPLELDAGILSAQYIITQVAYGRQEQYHGKFLDENHEIWDY